MEAALKAARGRLALITPELCQEYLQAWAADRERWRDHMEKLPVRLTLGSALEWLARAGHTPMTCHHAWGCETLATASPRHHLLVRRHLSSGELAFHFCFVPEGQPVSKARLIRAAGLRWPVEETFEFGKDCFGLDQSQVRLYNAIARHTVLVMAALAVCAITAALLRDRTDTQALPPTRPDQPPPADPGMIPLTIPELTRLLATPPARRPGHAEHWASWRRRHQARSRWYHQRARLARESALVR
jgi:hypothetical protein